MDRHILHVLDIFELNLATPPLPLWRDIVKIHLILCNKRGEEVQGKRSSS